VYLFHLEGLRRQDAGLVKADQVEAAQDIQGRGIVDAHASPRQSSGAALDQQMPEQRAVLQNQRRDEQQPGPHTDHGGADLLAHGKHRRR